MHSKNKHDKYLKLGSSTVSRRSVKNKENKLGKIQSVPYVRFRIGKSDLSWEDEKAKTILEIEKKNIGFRIYFRIELKFSFIFEFKKP